MCVIVPARDEAAYIEGTLDALAHQLDFAGRPLPQCRYEVIVLANNCADDTAARARAFARNHPAFALHVVELDLAAQEAHVGRARRLLMDEGYRRLTSLGKPRGVIASTDADTRVGRQWVAGLLAEFAAGVDAVGGRILVDHAELARAHPHGRRYHLWDVTYRYLECELEALVDPQPHDPWPRHFQHYGPSIALTAEMYAAIGGLPVRSSLEDVALHEALVLRDARIRHSPLVRVTTSGRSHGRTELGFAVQLGLWDAMSAEQRPFLVQSAAEVEAVAALRRSLRAAWRQATTHGMVNLSEATRLADLGAVDREFLLEALATAPTFGRLMQAFLEQRVDRVWRPRWPVSEIRPAIHDLWVRLAEVRGWSASAALLQQVEPIGFDAAARDVA